MTTLTRWLIAICLSLGWTLMPLAAHAGKQQQLWVTNSLGNDVQVFEVGSWQLLKQFEVGPNPHGISATADGRTVHIAIEGFGQPQGELLWLDTANFAITDRVAIGPLPNECECTPDGRWIYVPCADEHWWVIDGETKQVATKIRVGGRPHNTFASPDGRRMYLSPMGDVKQVSIVNLEAGHKVLCAIPFDGATRPGALSGDERLLFQQIDGLLGFQVADIATRKVVLTVQDQIPAEKQAVQSRSHGLAVRPDQQEIWSCNVEHHLVHVHEMTSGSYGEVATINMPGRVYWVSFSPDSKYAFVSVRSEGQVAVVDCQSKEIVTLLPAGREPKRTQVVEVQTEDSPERGGSQ